MVREATLTSQFDPEELEDFLNPWEHTSTPLDDLNLQRKGLHIWDAYN